MRLIDQSGDVSTYMGMDESTGNITIQTVQDVKPFLARMKALRGSADYTKKGIKEDWWHVCSIPSVVIMELRNKGIDVFNKEDEKKMLKEIQANYKFLMATEKRHV